MCGVMNYWAGPWNKQFNDRLKANNPKGHMDPLPAIQGVTYFDRVSQGNVITKSCKNPAGVYEWFVEWMYDHGPNQMLFTHGVEGIHFEMKDGQLFKLPSLSTGVIPTSGTYLKPDLNANNWIDDPFKLPEETLPSKKILEDTCRIAFLTPFSEVNDQYGADIQIARKIFCADVVYGNMTFDAALGAYKASVGSLVDQVLADFNKPNTQGMY
jgi:putative aldouronate transport system substrate-binding protein